MIKENSNKLHRGKNRINPNKTCFCCGKKITNRAPNAFYCKECLKIQKKITAIIKNFIYGTNLRNKIPGYDLKIEFRIIKKNEY